MSSKGKILVTGGTGYIGSHTVVELVNHGYEPVLVDNFSNSYREVPGWLEEIIGYKPIFFEADCTKYESFKPVFEAHPDLVGTIHFAAYKAVGESVENPVKYYKNNINSLLVLIELMEEFKLSNLVFSSSCTVYGMPDDDIQVTELTKLNTPTSPYGQTKRVSEDIIKNVADLGNLKSVMLRYFNPIGAHSSSRIGELPIGKPNCLVPFITQTAAGFREKLTVFGKDYNTPDGTNVRDYIHVTDLADAHIKALEYLKQQVEPTSVFNVGTGRGNTVLEVVEAFESVTDQKLNYQIGARRKGDVDAIYANADKAMKTLHWKPKYSLKESLLSAWKWQQRLVQLNLTLK